MEFSNVCKQFASLKVLDSFSYHFAPGKHCIVGENGCGKTTLLMLAAGLELPDSGEIQFNRQPVTDHQTKPLVGISTDKIIFPRFLTARQLIEFHCRCYDVPWPEQLIQELHFKAHVGTLAPDLSLGNQKKLSLILALTHNAQCLLLDEPSTGLDSYSRQYIQATLAAFNGTLIITSHDPVFTESSDYQVFSLASHQ